MWEGRLWESQYILLVDRFELAVKYLPQARIETQSIYTFRDHFYSFNEGIRSSDCFDLDFSRKTTNFGDRALNPNPGPNILS